MVRLDCKTAAVEVSVEFLASVYNCSMFAYRDSTSVKALLANATGLSSCKSVAPRPFVDASTCSTVSFSGSKYVSVTSSEIKFLILSNTSCWLASQANLLSFLSSCRNEAVW